ncbi:MAG: hypothetical protein ACK4RS_03400, partial [Thiothrix sp.]
MAPCRFSSTVGISGRKAKEDVKFGDDGDAQGRLQHPCYASFVAVLACAFASVWRSNSTHSAQIIADFLGKHL